MIEIRGAQGGVAWQPIGADMEKGADMRVLSAEIFENCGNFWIMED